MRKLTRMLVAVELSLVTLAITYDLTFQTTYCGWEGCFQSAGFPFSFIQPNGVGNSSFVPTLALLDFLVFLTLYYILVLILDRSLLKKKLLG